MGEVLLVHDLNMERAVAMKILKRGLALKEDRLLRFVDEAKCQARLQHPGVISVYDIGRAEDGRLFFTMRAVKGKDFDALIREVHETCSQSGINGESPSGWNFRRLIQILRQCSEAIAFAHEQGVIHRDLKPQNLTVGHHGDAMVLDWGIAKLLSQTHAPSTVEALDRYNTPAYQAPSVDSNPKTSLHSSRPTTKTLTPTPDFEVFDERETIDDDELSSPGGEVGVNQGAKALPRVEFGLDETPLVGVSISELQDDGAFEPLPSMGSQAHEQLAEWFTTSRSAPTEQDSLNQALQSLSRMSHSASFSTLEGTITGTPAYMSPEQASGQAHKVNQSTDVYALGCVLYHILVGQPPYTGSSLKEVLEDVKRGRYPKVVFQASSPFPSALRQGAKEVVYTSAPEALVRVCERAMSFVQEERYPSAKGFSEALGAWLDGVQQRQEALSLLGELPELKRRQVECLTRALELDAQAKRALSELPSWASEVEKAEGWSLEDKARSLRADVERLDLEIELKLRSAQRLAGSLLELHLEAASYYRSAHQRLIELKRDHEARRALSLLKEHAQALPEEHPERAGYMRYLMGEGTLRLSLPPGVKLTIIPEKERSRRLQFMEPVSSLDTLFSLAEEDHTPGVLDPFNVPLDHPAQVRCQLEEGSYLCLLSDKDPGPVASEWMGLRYHVCIEAQKEWSTTPPSGSNPPTLQLPAGLCVEEERFVPGGWCWTGDLDAPRSLAPARLWVDDFVIQARPVTHAEYLEFLNDLVESGRVDYAREHAPQELASSADATSELLYAQAEHGRYHLPSETGPLAWTLDRPVAMVNWWNACAYAEWRREKTGRPWRLPSEWEWEKAGRGVDGRAYPWGGSYIDPSWCCNRLSQQGTPSTAPVSSFPIDCSPYGVRGMAGNVAEWCLNPHFDEPTITPNGGAPSPSLEEALTSSQPARVAKGGAWDDGPSFCHLAIRHRGLAHYRRSGLGFRLAYALSDLTGEG